MAGDWSSPLVARVSARRPPSAPLTSPEPRPPGPAGRHRTCSFACCAPIGYSAGHCASPEGAVNPIGPQEARRTGAGGPGAASRRPGGPGQVEGAPARCVPSQEESQGGGWMQTEQVFLSPVAVWTDTLCDLFVPGITLLLLLYERNSVLHPQVPGGSGEDGGMERARVRRVRLQTQ